MERNLEIFKNAHLLNLSVAFSVLVAPSWNGCQDNIFERAASVLFYFVFPPSSPFPLPDCPHTTVQ